MTLYTIMALGFMVPLLCAAYFMGKNRVSLNNIVVVLGVMLILTAVFDSLIIAMGIVVYDSEKILGMYIIKAPIEDFSYAIVASVFAPALWRYLGREK